LVVREQRQFFVRRPGDKNDSQIYRREGNGSPEVLVDANSLSTAGKPKTLQLMNVSKDGEILAYGIR
jgi:protease II